eukprot:259731-Chlamydomonas_euryale.AAC.3
MAVVLLSLLVLVVVGAHLRESARQTCAPPPAERPYLHGCVHVADEARERRQPREQHLDGPVRRRRVAADVVHGVVDVDAGGVPVAQLEHGVACDGGRPATRKVRPHHLHAGRVEGVQAALEAQHELDKAVLVAALDLLHVAVQRALGVKRRQLHAPRVDVVADAVHDHVKALLPVDLEQLIRQHHEGLTRLKDLVLLGARLLVRQHAAATVAGRPGANALSLARALLPALPASLPLAAVNDHLAFVLVVVVIVVAAVAVATRAATVVVAAM